MAAEFTQPGHARRSRAPRRKSSAGQRRLAPARCTSSEPHARRRRRRRSARRRAPCRGAPAPVARAPSAAPSARSALPPIGTRTRRRGRATGRGCGCAPRRAGRRPVDARLGLVDLAGVGDAVLRPAACRSSAPRSSAASASHHQAGAEPRQPVVQLARGHVGRDRRRARPGDRAGVEPRLHRMTMTPVSGRRP